MVDGMTKELSERVKDNTIQQKKEYIGEVKNRAIWTGHTYVQKIERDRFKDKRPWECAYLQKERAHYVWT